MHSLRQLLAGGASLREGRPPLPVAVHCDRLLAVKRGDPPCIKVDACHKEFRRDFELALAETKLPERPDCEVANWFLVKARPRMASAV